VHLVRIACELQRACCRNRRSRIPVSLPALVRTTPGSETGEQFLLPNPSHAGGLDMGPWARRWGLMVLNDWLRSGIWRLIRPTALR